MSGRRKNCLAQPGSCQACFIYVHWHLIPWVRHTCLVGRFFQNGKTDEQLGRAPRDRT